MSTSLTTDKKPLVFISAASKDSAWRDRLTKKLDGYADQIEWWDSSKIRRDANDYETIHQIDAVIARARVAVLLLSRAYLEFDLTRAELDDLIKRAEANQLKMFPILLEPSSWSEIPALRQLPIWNWNRPIDDVSEAAEDELKKIVERIVDLARSTVQITVVPEPELRFSWKATAILDHAWVLADRSKRGRITSSCLLFALAEAPVVDDETRLIQHLLRSSHRYSIEFQAFLDEGRPWAEEPVHLEGVQWALTQNLSATLRRALNISQRVFLTAPRTGEIDPRHLFAALIASRGTIVPSVSDKLKRLGFDLASLRSELRECVRKVAPFEDPVAWDDVLGTQSSAGKPATQTITPPPDAPPYKITYSTFAPDRAAVGPRATGPLDDSLGVRTYAGHLAQLIAAKDTFMPLSIGLFGAWGAGKSHFIDLLDEELRKITNEPGQKFHKEIVQIRFNAWHYLDTNLWANLVSEIFDQLFTTVEDRGDKDAKKLKNLKQRLADQSALAAEAKAALRVAEKVRGDAEGKLCAAMKARAEQENTVSTMLDDLKNLIADDDDLNKQLRDVANGLGLPKIESSFNELEARVDEVRSVSGRGKAILLSVFTGPGRWKRATLLVAALTTPLVIAWLAANGGPQIENLLAGVGKTIAQLVTVIGLVSAWLGTQAKAGSVLVSKLELAYDKVKTVRAEREATDDAAKAQVALAQKQEAEEQARQNLRDAEEKLKNIQTELAEMAPGRQLIRFLRARATAEDYRRHLGLISLVRKDFDQLSKLLTDSASADNTLPKIDRIVLYIDDLDRCRADRVIEVLEAVHLLLAFSLFAVVVAVDPRWLRQSLLDQYPRLLGAIEGDHRTGSLGRAATPQDYLEKIFQVPFNLQPMEKTGFESLVKQLFSVELPKAPVETPSVTTQQRPDIALLEQQTAKAEAHTKIILDQMRAQFSLPEPTGEKVTPKQAPPDPERLVLTENEVKDVQRFQLLFQTPRALKRFANTYSLIRVGVAQDEWTNYLGFNSSPLSYRVPLLMLAVSAAYPSLARPWLLWLRETPPTHWQLDATARETLATRNSDTTDPADWEKLEQSLKRLDLDGWTPPSHEALAMWVPRVARYSF